MLFGGDLFDLGKGLAYHHISLVADKASSAFTVLKTSNLNTLLYVKNYILFVAC